MKRFFVVLAAFAIPFSGCGQSGPLYLPDSPSRIETVSPAPPGAEAADDEPENQAAEKP